MTHSNIDDLCFSSWCLHQFQFWFLFLPLSRWLSQNLFSQMICHYKSMKFGWINWKSVTSEKIYILLQCARIFAFYLKFALLTCSMKLNFIHVTRENCELIEFLLVEYTCLKNSYEKILSKSLTTSVLIDSMCSKRWTSDFIENNNSKNKLIAILERECFIFAILYHSFCRNEEVLLKKNLL